LPSTIVDIIIPHTECLDDNSEFSDEISDEIIIGEALWIANLKML
jgi:hypothetical protein